ncbi:Transcription antitermination protein NusG [Clostridiaceae bacterium JG1575]|nr:Transcription antitermination protein NusG [Clostridiaceae bacterium JG1575]
MEMGKAGWYVVHTYSGYENKVKVNLEKAIENRGMEDLIQEVEVPLEEVIERKEDGTEKRVFRKKFPGYVLVKMVMTEETWYVVRNIRGCTGFVGAKSNSPVPLTEDEVRSMGIRETRRKVDLTVGEPVTIISGPMRNFSATVTEVNEEKRKIKVEVQMFGRETIAEMDFDQVEKVK